MEMVSISFTYQKPVIQTQLYRKKKKDLRQRKRHNGLRSWITYGIVCRPEEKDLPCSISNVQTNERVGLKKY